MPQPNPAGILPGMVPGAVPQAAPPSPGPLPGIGGPPGLPPPQDPEDMKMRIYTLLQMLGLVPADEGQGGPMMPQMPPMGGPLNPGGIQMPGVGGNPPMMMPNQPFRPLG